MKIFLILICYLLGSISGSIVLGKLKGIDIRTKGSGNAGATNALRTVGKSFAAGVMIIDVLKSYLPLILIAYYFETSINKEELKILQIACGLSAVLGHVYPVFHNFKGGKGAGTLVGVVFAMFPSGLIYVFIAWILVLVLTGYVGLSTMIGGITLVIITELKYLGGVMTPFGYFTIGVAIFLIFTHKSNIIRMIKGKENRFEKIMLFKNIYK